MTKFKTYFMAIALGATSVIAPLAMTIPTYAATSSNQISAESFGKAIRRAVGRNPNGTERLRFNVTEDEDGGWTSYSVWNSSTGMSKAVYQKDLDITQSFATMLVNGTAKIQGIDPHQFLDKARDIESRNGYVKYEATVYPDNSVYGSIEMQDKQAGQRYVYGFNVK